MRRFVVSALAVLVACVVIGTAGAESTSAPVITLVSPGSGATIISSAATGSPAFKWQIAWDAPESTVVTLQVAADPAFTQNVRAWNQSCPSANVNCWDSYQPRDVFSPPYGSVWYWRVGMTTSAGTVYSPTWQFTAVNPPDRDKDGVPDSRDNCPNTQNPDQTDSNHDHVGDACQPDRVAPRVQMLRGTGHRGKTLFVTAKVGDDRGVVRMHLWVSYQHHPVLDHVFGWSASRVGQPHTFYSNQPFPTTLPTGIYQACVEAWDRAGNHAVSCAAYRIS